MKIGNKMFDLEHEKYIMGILNVTPDSFSDGGKYNQLDAALAHAAAMIEAGAAVIDVGGESTRPGHTQITDEEEIARTVPVIRALKEHFDIPVSIDTYKSAVARACLEAGADLLNDIWGFVYDRKMAALAAEYDVPCCLMHNRKEAVYNDFMEDVICDLQESVRIALEAGVKKENIMIDPGVGFAKSYEQNLEIIKNIKRLEVLGYPILLGTSRKSVIGLTLNIPAPERISGTVATTVYGAAQGCAFFRVHDVRENKQALDMTQAILKA
jgi:dihydropteroate synthase